MTDWKITPAEFARLKAEREAEAAKHKRRVEAAQVRSKAAGRKTKGHGR